MENIENSTLYLHRSFLLQHVVTQGRAAAVVSMRIFVQIGQPKQQSSLHLRVHGTPIPLPVEGKAPLNLGLDFVFILLPGCRSGLLDVKFLT